MSTIEENSPLKTIQSQSFIKILNTIVNQLKVKVSVYKLYQGIQTSGINLVNITDPEKFRNDYVTTMFNTSSPLTSFELIITEIPEISHSQEWKRYLEGSEVFSDLYSLISVISLLPGSNKWTSLIQRLHQRLFSPKYSTGMTSNSESLSIKQMYDSRLFELTDIKNNIITVLTYLQYTSLNNATVVVNTSTTSNTEKEAHNPQKQLLSTQLNIIGNTMYGLQSIPVEGLLNFESYLLKNFLTNTKQLSIDNYIFTVSIPILSYESPFLVLKNISYSFNEVIYDNQRNHYTPKSVELQMSFEPFMPRYIQRNRSISQITYNNRFYIEI